MCTITLTLLEPFGESCLVCENCGVSLGLEVHHALLKRQMSSAEGDTRQLQGG
jgi:hypothetical protein